MACFLTENIKHSCEYNPGGLKDLLLVDIRNFITYQFINDSLFNGCFIDSVKISASNYIAMDTIDDSNFTETQENGIYNQNLTSYIRTLNYNKTSDLLLASSNKYLVVFRTYQDKTFSFGSDGGASLNFSQISGTMGEGSGYQIAITKKSIFPLFEINLDNTQHITRIFNESFNDKFN